MTVAPIMDRTLALLRHRQQRLYYRLPRRFRKVVYDARRWITIRFGVQIRGSCFYCDQTIPIIGTNPHCPRKHCEVYEP